jgi:hypothetical protein
MQKIGLGSYLFRIWVFTIFFVLVYKRDPAATEQPRAMNVLVLFSSVGRSSELSEWDPIERLMRARVVGEKVNRYDCGSQA